MTLSAYRLSEELALDDKGYLYAHSEFETELLRRLQHKINHRISHIQ